MPKAGHFVPNNYYSPSYAFVSDYISNQKLMCHDTTNGCSVVAQRCEAMNYCNGNGSCNTMTGQCMCDSGYKFADCSKQVVDLSDSFTDKNITTHGPGWFTMQYSGSKNSTLTLSPNITSEVYILKGSNGDPNNFNYDMSFKSVLGNTTFDSHSLGLSGEDGYSIALYMNA